MFVPFQIETDESTGFRQPVPVLLYTILAVCGLVHLLLFLELSEATRIDIFYRFGILRFGFIWWTAFTCLFLHGSWAHLLGNLYFLWIYGRHVERFLGSARFALLYFGGGVLSIAIHLLTLPAFVADEPTIGASGAISAVLGAFLVLWPTAKLRCLLFSVLSFRPIIVEAPAAVVLGLWFIGQLFFGLNPVGALSAIAFWAHVGGFAAGAGIGTVFETVRRARLDQLESDTKEPVRNAWAAFLNREPDDAARHCSQIDEAAVHETVGSCQLLRGLLGWRHNRQHAAGHLLRAFCQARDYRSEPAMLSAYLQILQGMAPDEVAPAIHRDAGLAAFSAGQRNLAVQAFRHFAAGTCEGNLEPILRQVRALRRTAAEAGGKGRTAPEP